MLRPENTHPHDQDVVLLPAEKLETAQSAGVPDPPDSPSSEEDAGILRAPDIDRLDLDADDSLEDPMEITMTDYAAGGDVPTLNSSDMDDLSAPGEVDIEGLDEDALSDTDIPRDALLDPLEP
jgi:hypothetical protein